MLMMNFGSLFFYGLWRSACTIYISTMENFQQCYIASEGVLGTKLQESFSSNIREV